MATSFDQRFVVKDRKTAEQLRADVKNTKPKIVTAEKSRADRKRAAELLNRI